MFCIAVAMEIICFYLLRKAVLPGNSTQYSEMTYTGKESKEEWIYLYVSLIQSAVWQKLTQHVHQ